VLTGASNPGRPPRDQRGHAAAPAYRLRSTPRTSHSSQGQPSIASLSTSDTTRSIKLVNASFMSRSAERSMRRGFTRTTQPRWLARSDASSSSRPHLNICRPRSGRIPGITKRSRSTIRLPRGSSRTNVRNKARPKQGNQMVKFREAGPLCHRMNGASGRRGVSVMNFCTKCGSRPWDPAEDVLHDATHLHPRGRFQRAPT
jgi:hypothetical protein